MGSAKKKGGTENFKTTIRDPTIQSLTANVTFTDIKKTETVSNVLTTNLHAKKLSVPIATPDLDDSTNIQETAVYPIDFDYTITDKPYTIHQRVYVTH